MQKAHCTVWGTYKYINVVIIINVIILYIVIYIFINK